MALRVRNWEISTVVMESFMSCLLAKIRTEAFCRACGQRSQPVRAQPPFPVPHECHLQERPMPKWGRDGGPVPT